MIQKINKIINPIITLTNEELSTFSNAFESARLSKNDLFLKEGQVCDFIGFVNYGVMIYFKTKDNGDEINY
jgi:hypothetical protein